MRKVMFALAMVMFTTVTANASWQLIPGKPYDGLMMNGRHSPITRLKEPCWSIATSKCALEQNRTQYNENARKAPQR